MHTTNSSHNVHGNVHVISTLTRTHTHVHEERLGNIFRELRMYVNDEKAQEYY